MSNEITTAQAHLVLLEFVNETILNARASGFLPRGDIQFRLSDLVDYAVHIPDGDLENLTASVNGDPKN